MLCSNCLRELASRAGRYVDAQETSRYRHHLCNVDRSRSHIFGLLPAELSLFIDFLQYPNIFQHYIYLLVFFNREDLLLRNTSMMKVNAAVGESRHNWIVCDNNDRAC